eukprot:403350329
MQKFQDQQQQRQGGGRASEAASIFGQGLGGANAAIQAQQQDIKQPITGLFNPFGGILGNKADGQQQKDLRRLESYLVKSCIAQCLKKERNYHCDSELCLTKCYDTAFIYMRVGLNEINQFAYENNISY